MPLLLSITQNDADGTQNENQNPFSVSFAVSDVVLGFRFGSRHPAHHQTLRPAVSPMWNWDVSTDEPGPLPEEIEPVMGMSTTGPSEMPTCSTGERTNIPSMLTANWLCVVLLLLTLPDGGVLMSTS